MLSLAPWAGVSSKHHRCPLQIPDSGLTFLAIFHLLFLTHQTAIPTPFPFPLRSFTETLDEFMEDRLKLTKPMETTYSCRNPQAEAGCWLGEY